MKHTHPNKTQGKRLSRIYLANKQWKTLNVDTEIPDSSKLFNFVIHAVAQDVAHLNAESAVAHYPESSFLILDPYGNETMASDQMNRLVGAAGSFALAIDRKTGDLFFAHFKTEKKKGSFGWSEPAITVVFVEIGDYQVPKSHLKHLDELKSQKRPFSITCRDVTLLAFMDQEACWDDLRKNIIVELSFHKHVLQIWGDCSRTVSHWK